MSVELWRIYWEEIRNFKELMLHPGRESKQRMREAENGASSEHWRSESEGWDGSRSSVAVSDQWTRRKQMQTLIKTSKLLNSCLRMRCVRLSHRLNCTHQQETLQAFQSRKWNEISVGSRVSCRILPGWRRRAANGLPQQTEYTNRSRGQHQV